MTLLLFVLSVFHCSYAV